MRRNENKILPKAASKSVATKNIVEGCRCGVLSVSKTNSTYNFRSVVSTEHTYALCGQKTPDHFPEIFNAKQELIWDQNKYQFLANSYSANDSSNLKVHPALWNNGTNNLLSGVFEVLPGKIYQVRGYDMANITFVKTNNITSNTISANDYWLVMDTLMSEECTTAALILFNNYICSILGDPEIAKDKLEQMKYLYNRLDAIIISHSHVDHYGGMSVVNECLCKNVKSNIQLKDEKNTLIIVPKDFTEHAVSENVYVGNAMGRRASYQYGSFIKPGAELDCCSGSISIGIGQGQSTGTIGFEAPTYEVTSNETLTINELKVVCQMTPGTEAPAEMNNYFPQYHALWLAENCTGTLHNLYTLRGAQVRDGNAWAKFLVEAAVLFSQDLAVIFQSHNWPHWATMPDSGKKLDLRDFILETASIYKYINDQTLYYMNQGYKMNEAADMLTIPRKLQKNWCTMPFYGTPKHNAKAVYQKYLGWYDANPLHLEELPPELLAQEQMRYMLSANDITSMLSLIEEDIQRGNYWTAAYMAQQIILGNNDANVVANAKELCADALEQLGYQAQSGTWRNAYLCAAYELRNEKKRVSASSSNATVQYMTSEMLLDYIAILFDGERASTKVNFDGVVHIHDEQTFEDFALIIRNGAIMYYPLADLINTNEIEISPQIGGKQLSVSKDTLLEILSMTQDVTKTDWDIYQFLLKIKQNNDMLIKQIASCMVNLKLDRYKYFDIMNRHDSEVRIDGKLYDLKTVVFECIKFLNTYKSTVENMTKSIQLAGADLSEWKKYYSILKDNSNVVLEGDFITADNNGTLGIGYDGLFQKYEYWYTMYSLHRYLGRSYVNNDCCYQDADSSVEDLIKLKKKIQILESYVPDLYLGGNVDFDKIKYYFDTEDSNAWLYLCGEDYAFIEGFYARDIFKELYECYRQLLLKLGILGTDNN